MRDEATLSNVRRTYARWARFYDPTHRILPLRRLALDALGLRPGDRVLEVACGTGLNLERLRSAVGPEGTVVGIDLSPDMLRVAARMIERQGWQNVSLRETDAARLPFDDALFDAVLCTYALNVIPDHVAAIQEMKRVLRIGGRFAILDTDMRRMRPTRLNLPCAMRMGRDLAADVRRVFPDARLMRRWAGRFLVLTGTRQSGSPLAPNRR